MTIEFSCEGCRYPFKVPDSMAGKKGKCPKCGAITSIPLSGASPIATEPSRPPAIPPASPDDRGSDDRGRDDRDDFEGPRPRKKKSSTGLIVGLVIGGLVLVGGGLALWLFLRGGGLSDEDLKFLPSNSKAVVSIKVAEFLDSGLWKDAMKDMPGGNPEKEMEKELGFPPRDIDRIIIGGDEQDGVFIIRTRKNVTASEVTNVMKKTPKFEGISFSESKVGAYTINKTEEGDEGPAFCVVNPTLVVVSTRAKALEPILKRDKKAEFGSSFQAVYKKADFSKTFALAVDLKSMMKSHGPGDGKGGMHGGNWWEELTQAMAAEGGLPDPAMLGMIGDVVEGFAASVKIGSGVDATASIVCKDSATADNFKKGAEGGVSMMRMQAPPDAQELINKIKFSSSGNTVTVNVSISQSLINKLKRLQ